MQLGEVPANITEAEQQRLKAVAENDEDALLQANAGLLAAMLDCQYGHVALNPETAEIQLEVGIVFIGNRKSTSPV